VEKMKVKVHPFVEWDVMKSYGIQLGLDSEALEKFAHEIEFEIELDVTSSGQIEKATLLGFEI